MMIWIWQSVVMDHPTPHIVHRTRQILRIAHPAIRRITRPVIHRIVLLTSRIAGTTDAEIATLGGAATRRDAG